MICVIDVFLVHTDPIDLEQYPGQIIRPIDSIVFDRIRVGFHRNPISFIKNRSDPTRFSSDSFQSESGPDCIGIQRSAMKYDQIRQDPIPPL